MSPELLGFSSSAPILRSLTHDQRGHLVLPVRNPVPLEGAVTSPVNLRAMPGRSPHEIDLSDAERAELKHLAACYTRPHREVQRAKLVLLAAEGKANTEIGERLARWPSRLSGTSPEPTSLS